MVLHTSTRRDKFVFFIWSASRFSHSEDKIFHFNARIEGVETHCIGLEQSTEKIIDIKQRLERLEKDLSNKELWSRNNIVELASAIGYYVEFHNQQSSIKGQDKLCYPLIKQTRYCVFHTRYVKGDFVAATRIMYKETLITLTTLELHCKHRIFVKITSLIKTKYFFKTPRKLPKRIRVGKKTHQDLGAPELSPILNIKAERDLLKIVFEIENRKLLLNFTIFMTM